MKQTIENILLCHLEIINYLVVSDHKACFNEAVSLLYV